jgi:hypothetical protein
MLHFQLFGMQVTVPTPTDTPPDELLDKAERVIDIWNSLGPLMAILGVAALALIVIGLISYSSRNSSSTAIKVLEKISERQDKEIIVLQQQSTEDRGKYIESIKVVAEQSTRANDLFEAMNNRGGQRDLQQQRMVELQAQIAANQKTMIESGSEPVREIKAKVGEIKDIVTRIDTHTADWNGILQVITPLLVELGALRQEAKKHSTQPIPKMDIQTNGEMTIQGTIEGTIVQDGDAL